MDDLVSKCFIGLSLRRAIEGWFELDLVIEWEVGTCIPRVYLRVEAAIDALNSYLSKVVENLFRSISTASRTPSNLLIIRFSKGGILSLPLANVELIGL
jgi:hypothetical protein